MSYQVLARKWRPKSFREMAGQEHVLKALINSLDHNRLHHAYLFTGTRGVGKTTIARILAKCLNCERGVSSEPCGTCTSCVEINEGRFVDLIEIDAASHTGVDDVRELIDNAQYLPTRGRFKVYLIDEVHMLSKSAFNALLKTLEEPPPHVKFLLATTDPQKLPVTILSRCLQFNLKNLSSERIKNHLQHVLQQEMIEFDEAALWQLGRAADGSMRDALSLTDQAIGYGNGKVKTEDVRQMLGTIHQQHVLNLLLALRDGDAPRLLQVVADLSEHNPDYSQALDELLSLLHRVAVLQAVPEYQGPGEEHHATLRQLAGELAAEDIQLFYQIGLQGQRDLPLAPESRAGFEMVLLRMLAFKPHGVPKLPQSTPQTRPGQDSAPAPASKPGAPAATGASPKKPEPALVAPVNFDLSHLSPDNWHLFFQQLSLGGVLHNIANHCILSNSKRDQERWQLHFILDETQAALFNSAHQERLATHIGQKHNCTVTVAITLGTAHRETPHAIEQRLQQERLEAARKLFTGNEQVQSVLRQFDGKIIPDSIKPLHH